MLKILILEDEEPAAKRLLKMVKEAEPDAVFADPVVSVSSAIKWLKENEAPDLIISDIQLSDGISFEVFREVPLSCPVIFTTAYDQYALEAFKVNSIDYLLKPIKKTELEAALAKFKKVRSAAPPLPDIVKLLQAYGERNDPYKKRFIVRYGDHIKTIHTEEIAYFDTSDKINFLTTSEGRRFTVDLNLDQLETQLDPKKFFRINRQFIISIHAISEMLAYTKSRVLIKLKPAAKTETIVSTERSAAFKAWLDDAK